MTNMEVMKWTAIGIVVLNMIIIAAVIGFLTASNCPWNWNWFYYSSAFGCAGHSTYYCRNQCLFYLRLCLSVSWASLPLLLLWTSKQFLLCFPHWNSGHSMVLLEAELLLRITLDIGIVHLHKRRTARLLLCILIQSQLPHSLKCKGTTTQWTFHTYLCSQCRGNCNSYSIVFKGVHCIQT